MRLFKTDLPRNFAIGFAVGTAIAVWQIAPQMSGELIPPAQAATIAAPAQ
ncbi:hypothetical protein GCM10011515_25350 [Tsuneonella deserti]|uniref:Uncharacterized protein n=1 Tax=Tsuneonella deserti TaxID=2035528 RepID=A0ABQ1SCG5_9SPHN|nr:hypothetical protein [Tsuneonella deserti]GGE04677.1 hypothetical protein GCM10011515_25350 [Tsuneonella deserti]